MTAAALAIRGASWTPPRHPSILLKPVTLSLAPGRVLGVVGANGAGKSTLLRLIYRYHRPHAGAVELDGVDIWSVSARTVARRVAAVLQEQPTDFALTVREIVELGRTPHRGGFAAGGERDAEIIDEALDRLDLAGLAARRFGTLSGGERQRVVVARALAQQPGLLVLDEPTNHLDIRHQLEILDLIRGLDMTIVASLHDLNMAADVCDDILLLRLGETLGFGPPAEVLSEAAVSAAFGVRARRQRLETGEPSHFIYERHP